MLCRGASFDLPMFGTWPVPPADTGWCDHEDRMVDTTAPPSPVMRTVTYCVDGQYGFMQINVADCYYPAIPCTSMPSMPLTAPFDPVPTGFCGPAAAARYLRVVTIDDGETVFTTRTHRVDPCLVS